MAEITIEDIRGENGRAQEMAGIAVQLLQAGGYKLGVAYANVALAHQDEAIRLARELSEQNRRDGKSGNEEVH